MPSYAPSLVPSTSPTIHVFEQIRIYSDGVAFASLDNLSLRRSDFDSEYFAFEAVVQRGSVYAVDFFFDNEYYWSDYLEPYYYGGDRRGGGRTTNDFTKPGFHNLTVVAFDYNVDVMETYEAVYVVE